MLLIKIQNNQKITNNVIFLGKIGDLLSKKIHDDNPNMRQLKNYNISIAEYEIKHMMNEHDTENEWKRGQKRLTGYELMLLPDFLINTKKIIYMGVNEFGLDILNFISHNEDGTYNLLEFIGNGKHLLGFQSLYINISIK